MFTKFFISAFSMLIISSCAGQKTATTDKTEKSTTNNNELTITPPENFSNLSKEKGKVTLEEGENKFLSEYNMNVTFKRVIDDSRCPKGLECVWEGAATAEIEFMGTYSRPMTLSISTVNNAERNLSKDAIFNGYKISLVEVNPYPTSSKKPSGEFGKKQIVLEIVKLTDAQIEASLK